MSVNFGLVGDIESNQTLELAAIVGGQQIRLGSYRPFAWQSDVQSHIAPFLDLDFDSDSRPYSPSDSVGTARPVPPGILSLGSRPAFLSNGLTISDLGSLRTAVLSFPAR